MKLRLLLALLFYILSTHIVLADTTKYITLQDGSIIRGELISLENGIYTIQNESLGRLQLPEANVVNVANENPRPPRDRQNPENLDQDRHGRGGMGNGGLPGQVFNLQNQIMANPEFLQVIQGLAEDPEIAAVMADPSFVQELSQAVSTNNIDGLANNPKMQRIMSNPKMQALIQQIQAQAPHRR